MLFNKRILVAVCGGVAAYKAAELVRLLRLAGAEVQVVMTAAAGEFITPLTLQALSGRPVRQSLFDPAAEAGMGHIELARWPDLVVVAPASADTLARLAQGRADDLLGAIHLATRAPVLLAPAMNQAMWSHPATQANLAAVTARGVLTVGPESGSQACGDEGPGRLANPQTIIAAVEAVFATGILAGARVLVTAGPTREAIDDVRFIANRSSGKMGFALADAAREAGASVTLVSGPVHLPPPDGVRLVPVQSAEDMLEAVMAAAPVTDIVIGAAAVADYRPAERRDGKLKKTAPAITLELERTTDILGVLAEEHPDQFRVGFAAEVDDIATSAREKLVRKGLAMVIANDVSDPGIGFDSDENAVEVFWGDESRVLPRASKARLARALIELVAERYDATSRAAPADRASLP